MSNIGAFVDVFPIDGLGNNLSKAKKILLSCKKIQYKIGLGFCQESKFSIYNLVKNLYCRLLFCFKNYYYNKYIRICTKNDYFSSKYVAFCGSYYGEKEIMEREYFSNFILKQFEDDFYPVPIEFDKYLKKIYGKYLELPPKEKQITHHSFKVYLKK